MNLLLGLGLASASFALHPAPHGLARSSAAAPRRAPRSVMSSAVDEVMKYYKHEADAVTKSYIMQQTMLRVKDPVKSLQFYCEVLGFHLVMHRDFPQVHAAHHTAHLCPPYAVHFSSRHRTAGRPSKAHPPARRPPTRPLQWGFTVYFVAAVDPATIPGTPEEQWSYCMRTPGCIELTHNHGSEKEEGKVYNTGNSDPTGTTDGEKVRGGFGHLGVTVPDVYEACARFASLGCAPMLRTQGRYGRPERLKAAAWPRMAEARGSPEHGLALKEASGEPAGRRRSQLRFRL